mgnify:FL=1
MVFCFCFLAGIVVFSLWGRKFDLVILVIFLSTLVALAFIFRKNKKVFYIFLSATFFAAAAFRFSLFVPGEGDDYLKFYNNQNLYYYYLIYI